MNHNTVDLVMPSSGNGDHNEHQDKEDMSSILANLFLDDDYSIEHLLKRARDKDLNLRELHDQLVKHQQSLQQTSLELFNNSYDRFFKLSHLISCLAEPIQHVIHPIQNYRNQLGRLCQSHDSYLQEVDKKLVDLENVSRNKLLAERLIVLVRRRDRIFEQIHRIYWLKSPSIDSLISELHQKQRHQPSTIDNSIVFKVNCDSIERVYIELNYLLCEVYAIHPTSDQLVTIKSTLESSLREQQKRLDDWLVRNGLNNIRDIHKLLPEG